MRRTANIVLAILVLVAQMRAASPRPITVEDCVRTRRVVEDEVQLSPDGSRVAYVVKAPNTTTNRNDYELYVRDLNRLDERENGRMVVRADGLSGVRWLGPERLIARISNKSEKGEIDSYLVIVDAPTGLVEKLDLPGRIEDFSASADGREIVFSVLAPAEVGEAEKEQEKIREERGYAIGFGDDPRGSAEALPEYEIFLATRQASGPFDIRKLGFSRLGGPAGEFRLRAVSRLNLSPDGKYLLLRYSSPSLPTEWGREPYFDLIRSWGTPFYTYVLGLYDLATHQLRVGFNFPGAFLETRWSDDSRFYCVVGPSPFGTDQARRETARAQATGDLDEGIGRLEDVFTVDPATGSAKEVVERESTEAKILSANLPVSWEHGNGPLLVRTDSNKLARMEMDDGRWKVNSHLSLPADLSFASSLQGNGRILVGIHQTTMVPPDLFVLDLVTGQWQLLTDLGPEYREIELGEVEAISWTNRYGSKCSGFLIKPVGYQPGKRYPMVLLSAPPVDAFISDAMYTTAYAPQSLANSGFVVLVSQYPRDNRIPAGSFPGQMREAYNWMAMIESAVNVLVRRGLADPHDVGIAGFSRTSWLVDFTLTHSAYRFTAASSADSGIYTYGVYFRYNRRALMKGMDTQVGGPPWGRTMSLWLKYAPPFNAEKVRTPVLMEYRGTGEPGFEFFTALSRLGKPVELYCYPKGTHPLDTPFEREASLQRNVDWFRFWMQGYEGKPPQYDPGQYDRWRGLRASGIVENKATAGPSRSRDLRAEP